MLLHTTKRNEFLKDVLEFVDEKRTLEQGRNVGRGLNGNPNSDASARGTRSRPQLGFYQAVNGLKRRAVLMIDQKGS